MADNNPNPIIPMIENMAQRGNGLDYNFEVTDNYNY